jgi:hypothetical protein
MATALPVTCPVNVAALDERDPKAGNASHRYAVQYGGPTDVLEIQFQHGARGEPGSKAGVFEDALLAILEDRLDGFQHGPFACHENGSALEAIRDARAYLNQRVAARMKQQVLGVNKAHAAGGS